MEVEKQSDSIKKAIRDSVIDMKALDMIPARFENFFGKDDCENVIYDKTIKSEDFNLYSPRGIESSIGEFPSLSKDENDFLSIFADAVGNHLINHFSLPLSSDTSRAYAVPTGNHYNIVVPKDFFVDA